MGIRKGGWLALAFLAASGTTALAAEARSDEECAKVATRLCGAKALGDCFQDDSMWGKAGFDCEGAIQTLIENEVDAAQAEKDAVPAVGRAGMSYGGVLRKAPSMTSPKVTSLKIGDKLEVVEDPDIWMDDYKWFKVRTAKGTGYHWGGIFCIPGDKLPGGVFDACQYMKSAQ